MNIGKKKFSLTERPEHPARVLQTGNNCSTIKSEPITENVEISGIHNKPCNLLLRVVDPFSAHRLCKRLKFYKIFVK